LHRKPRYLQRNEFLRRGAAHCQQPDSRARQIFSRWLGDRYTRPAFPDAFNALLRKDQCAEKIKYAVDKLTKCSGLFFGLNDWTEAPTDSYRVVPVLLMLSTASLEELAAAETAFLKIVGLLGGVGVEVIQESNASSDSAAIESLAGVKSEDQVSIAAYRQLAKWQLDYLTSRDTTGQHTLPAPAI